MKLGVVSNAILEYETFEEGLAYLQGLGLEAIEIACAGYHANLKFGDAELLAEDADERARWADAIERHGLEISALAIHGPALAPDPVARERYRRQFLAACRLAEQLGVRRLTCLAGLPEGAEGDRSPLFVSGAWPPVNQEILAWQWEQRVLPFWREHGAIAAAHGCVLCFEMHPNDVVYNPRTLTRLRAEVGDVIGCNFDPSHLFWYGIDPLEALRQLGDAVYHVHAKDLQVNAHNVRLNGLLDPTPFSDLAERAWTFRSVGFGHGEEWWRAFVSTLRAIGYDDVLSIEHEDEYMDTREGLEKGVELLTPMLLRRPRGKSIFELTAA